MKPTDLPREVREILKRIEKLRDGGAVEDFKELANDARSAVEKHISAMENPFRVMADQLDEAVLVVDTELVITYANQMAASIHGVEPARLVGRHSSELPRHHDQMAIWENYLITVRDTGDPRTFELIFDDSGNRRIFQVRVSTLRKEGQVTGLLTMGAEITRRKEAEEALKREHQMLSLLTDSLPSAVVLVNEQQQITFANSVALEILGMPRKELLSVHGPEWKWRLSRLNGDPIGPENRPVTTVLKSGKDVYERQFLLWRDDGITIPISLSARLLKMPGQDRPFVSIVFRDITAFLDDQTKIYDLARFPEENPSPIFRVDLDGNILFCNPAADPLLAAWNTGVGKKVPEEILISLKDIYTLGHAHREQVQIGKRQYLLTIAPIISRSYVNIYAIDVTQMQLLQVERDRLHLAIEQSIDAVILTDESGVIQYVNKACAEMFGMPRSSLINRRADMIRPDDHDESSKMRIAEAIRSGKNWTGTVSTSRSDGSRLILQVTISPVLGPDNTIVSYVAVQRDVTQIMEMEQEQRIRQKHEAIGTLAAGVAHEINNPLNGIIGYAELLIDTIDKDSGNRDLATGIIEESERIANIVRNLMKFARPTDEGKARESVNNLVEDTVALIRTVLRHDGIVCQTVFSSGLSPIVCNRQQIQQVLLSLITNARESLNLKYPETNPDKQVEIQTQQLQTKAGNRVRITISDRGIGIKESELERIFDPFYALKSGGKTVGMGLPISLGIIREHGGELTAESSDGVTRFHIDLPAIPSL